MVAIRVSPVNRAEIFGRVLALDLHDVDLTARGPTNRTDAVAEHPESRPDALTLRRVDTSFNPRVDAERLFPLRLHTRRRVCAAAKILAPRFDHEHAI